MEFTGLFSRLPFPVELLRFLEHNSLPDAQKATEERAARRRAATTRSELSAEEEARALETPEDVPAAIAPTPEIPEVPEARLEAASAEAAAEASTQAGGASGDGPSEADLEAELGTELGTVDLDGVGRSGEGR